MTLLDHVFVAGLAIGLPAYELIYETPKRMRDHSRTSARRRLVYLKIIALEFIIGGAVAALWIANGRDWTQLGFQLPTDGRFWIGTVACGVIAAVVVGSQVLAIRRPDGRAEMHRQFERTAPFMPRGWSDLGWWCAVAVAAGIAEEIAYRGYLFWYGRELFGDGWVSSVSIVVLAALVFMLGHLYQGRKGTPQVLGFAIIVGGLYLLTESLWPLIVLHAVMDTAGGVTAARLSGDQGGIERSDPAD